MITRCSKYPLGAIALGFLLLITSRLSAAEQATIRSEILAEEAWVGQRVRFAIILASPGPFSGTARFQLPEIPETVIVHESTPLLGTETINGVSMVTQRHEFNVYTQQDGTVTIPAIDVLFESKNDFIGEPVARNGKSSPLSFQSKRPPGTDHIQFLVTSSSLRIEQNWSPSDRSALEAGEVISRRITRTASDLSAMFLESFPSSSVPGLRVYPRDPESSDKNERGTLSARRVDTIDYQIERGGKFTLPEINYSWWDPEERAVKVVLLEGISFQATAPPVPREPLDKKTLLRLLLGSILFVFLSIRFLCPFLLRRYRSWHRQRHSPANIAKRTFIASCKNGEPVAAYGAFMKWHQASGARPFLATDLQPALSSLSASLYGDDTSGTGWSGSRLLQAFREEQRLQKHSVRRLRGKENLPPLNPTS